MSLQPTHADMPHATRVRYLVAGLIASCAVSLYLTRHVLAVTNMEIQEELGIGSGEMGTVMGLFSLGYLLFQVPGGWLGNKIGTRKGLALLSILWSALTLLTASVYSLIPLAIARFLFGAAQAGFVPITARIIKDWFPEETRGITSAFVGISMSIGGALAMDATGRLTGFYDWRTIFRAYSIVGVFWSIAFLFWFRSRPSSHPRVNQAEVQLIEGCESAVESSPGPFFTRRNFWILLASLNLWAICAQSFCRAAGYNFFVTFFPEFLSERFPGVSDADAGIYTKWPLIGVVAGGLMGGWLIDLIFKRSGNRWLSRSAVAATTLVLTAVFAFLSASATTVTGFVSLFAVAAILSGFGSPAAWTATIDVGGRHTAVVAGVMNMAGCLAGVLVTPLLGRMIQSLKQPMLDSCIRTVGATPTLDAATLAGWSQVVYLHAAFYLVGGLLWLLVRPEKTLLPEPPAKDV